MGTTAYYDKDYNRIEVESSEIVELARKGVIAPDTYVETNGVRRLAKSYPSLAKVFEKQRVDSANPNPSAKRSGPIDISAFGSKGKNAPQEVDVEDKIELVSEIELAKPEPEKAPSVDTAVAPIASLEELGASAFDEPQEEPQEEPKSTDAGRVCAKCGQAIAPGYVFCPNCGTNVGANGAGGAGSVPRYCPNCGAAADNALYCSQCGALLNGASNAGAQPTYVQGNSDGFMEANKVCWIKWNDMSGRASRSEFLYFLLGCLILSILLSAVSGGILGLVVLIATLFPTVTVTVRRLHDANMSGAWAWLYLAGLGLVLMIMGAVCESTPGDNKYGPMPKTY